MKKAKPIGDRELVSFSGDKHINNKTSNKAHVKKVKTKIKTNN